MRARMQAGGAGCKRGQGPAECLRTVSAMSTLGNQAVLRRLAAARGTQRRVAPSVVHEVLSSGGRALDAGTRAFFEPRLGADLGAVRVHDSALAARSAQAVDAEAYAVGPHVVFDAGRLAPSHPEGFQLLAHELVHVVQSGTRVPQGDIRIGEPGAPEEQSATHAAARLSAALPAGLDGGAAEPALRRQPPDENKPAPKPLIPVPVFDQFDPFPYVPTPGGSAPTPYDQPGNIPGPSGKGPSLEDLRGAREKLFGKTPLNLGLNKNPQMPPCSALETADSTMMAPKYWTYEQYDVQQRLYHGPLAKDAWPKLSPEQYKAAIDACPKALPPPAKGDFPGPALPPGQAMV